MMSEKICIINIYFGALPNYFALFLQSCKYNPNIDFIIFTDNEILSNTPNVKIIKTDLLHIRALAVDKLGIENISMEYAYKVVDFRPAYGVIFSDYLEDYDYWGHCDVDLIFGDLEKFFSEYQLNKYEKFLTKGHLSLYRNNEKVNRAYMLPGAKYGDNKLISYREVFTTNKNYIFDEINGIGKILEQNDFKYFKDTIFADVLHLHKRLKLWNLSNYEEQIFYWKEGKVYRKFYDSGHEITEEYIYIHMQKRKYKTEYLDICMANKAYYICPDSFQPFKLLPVTDAVKLYNPYMGKIIENLDHSIKKNKYMFKVYKSAIKRRWKSKKNSG